MGVRSWLGLPTPEQLDALPAYVAATAAQVFPSVVSQRHAQHSAAAQAAVAPHAPLGPRVALADDVGPIHKEAPAGLPPAGA